MQHGACCAHCVEVQAGCSALRCKRTAAVWAPRACHSASQRCLHLLQAPVLPTGPHTLFWDSKSGGAGLACHNNCHNKCTWCKHRALAVRDFTASPARRVLLCIGTSLSTGAVPHPCTRSAHFRERARPRGVQPLGPRGRAPRRAGCIGCCRCAYWQQVMLARVLQNPALQCRTSCALLAPMCISNPALLPF